MKRGTTPIIPVAVDIDIDQISEVDFIFKNECREQAPAILKKSFPADVAYYDGAFHIPLTESETRLFNGYFYMDTRIVTVNGVIPETEICKLYMSATLFSEGET